MSCDESSHVAEISKIEKMVWCESSSLKIVASLAGITPADSKIAMSIEEDRKGQFEMLKSTLEVMRVIDAKSSDVDIVSCGAFPK